MTFRERMIRQGRCIDCACKKRVETLRCLKCGEKHRRKQKGRARTERLGPEIPPHPLVTPTFGLVEAIELRADLLAGESSAMELAERHGRSVRFIERAREKLRNIGLRVRTPIVEPHYQQPPLRPVLDLSPSAKGT